MSLLGGGRIPLGRHPHLPLSFKNQHGRRPVLAATACVILKSPPSVLSRRDVRSSFSILKSYFHPR